jgi:predicted transcriptional regulator
MATTANFSIRIPAETKEKLDALAAVVGRPRNYLIAEALERYIASESWQLEEIQAGLDEDEAGLGVPHEQVMADVEEVLRAAEARRTS